LNTQPHLIAFWPFWIYTTIYFLFFSFGLSWQYHSDYSVSTTPSVSCEIYGGFPFIPIVTQFALNLTSIIEDTLIWGAKGGS
jgi:hypothetical protein